MNYFSRHIYFCFNTLCLKRKKYLNIFSSIFSGIICSLALPTTQKTNLVAKEHLQVQYDVNVVVDDGSNDFVNVVALQIVTVTDLPVSNYPPDSG